MVLVFVLMLILLLLQCFCTGAGLCAGDPSDREGPLVAGNLTGLVNAIIAVITVGLLLR